MYVYVKFYNAQFTATPSGIMEASQRKGSPLLSNPVPVLIYVLCVLIIT